MAQKADLRFVEPLRKELKRLNRNKQCVYPGCQEEPIGSHIIAQSVLKLLADGSKVLTWERSDDDIVVNAIRGHERDHVYQQPKEVGIETEVTHPIFCAGHDNDLFKPLEKPGYSYEPQQVALLAYRALCSKTWNPNLEEKLEFLLAKKDSETAQQYFRIFALKALVEAREKFRAMIETQDYTPMAWKKIVFHIDPCFACTDAIIPYHDDEDLRNIASGDIILTQEDVVTFTFYPDEHLNASICYITWFKDSIRGESFRKDLELDGPSLREDLDSITTNVLGMSIIYSSHTWWNRLTSEKRNTVAKIQLSKVPSLSL